MKSIDLSGKVALVTGASRGIGRSIALGLAEAGADVTIAARDMEALESLRTEIVALGRKVVVAVTDVTNVDSINASVESTITELGGLDILVNNAGGNSFSAPAATMRMDGWSKTLRLNLDSVMHYCQAAAPYLFDGGGSVINVSSVSGLRGTPFMAHYAAAKAGVVSLTQTLALEWAHAGVRVNALCPGWIETDLTAFLHSNSDASAATVANVPMQRWGQAEEMVWPALFLASDASSFVTGQVLVADGGLSLV